MKQSKRPTTFHRRAAIAGLSLGLVTVTAMAACGTPADPESGGAFARASMQGGGAQESLVSTRSIELVSWLVQFNRLNSAEKLETMLNKKPGQFFPVDADADGAHDYIAVAAENKPRRGEKGLVLSARPAKGEETKVATLFFDGDWGFLGYERMGSGSPPSASTIAAAAGKAATYAATPPPAASATPSGPLTLKIAAGGSMTLAGEYVGADQLRARVEKIARERPGAKVVIEADAAVAEADVMSRVDDLTSAGITQISIAERSGDGGRALAQADAPSPVKAVGAGAAVDPGVRPASP